jgi:hypothetical protein
MTQRSWEVVGGWRSGGALLQVGLLRSVLNPMSNGADELIMQLASFLFPVIYSIPVFDLFGLPFGTSLAADWMWW